MNTTKRKGCRTMPTPTCEKGTPWFDLPIDAFPSPCFIVDETRLLANANILAHVAERTGAKVLLALKGYAMFSTFALLQKALSGTCASSPHEARLGREEFGGISSTFAAGYSEADIRDIIPLSDHIIFNSFNQYRKFSPLVAEAREKGRGIECGMRINPEHSEGAVAIYNPCSPSSRLGVRHTPFAEEAAKGALKGISGLHCHTLCQQNADAFVRTFAVVEKNFGCYLHDMDWYNCGGGHHITRADYNISMLCDTLIRIRETYGVQVYIEPGEAVALNSGVLKATVLDIIEADMPVVILDTSAAAHMPDVLEMPYRPEVTLADGSMAGETGELRWNARLAGKSCLAGDVIGEYSFPEPLKEGDVILLMDMAIYSMVKTTTFNGLQLPSIGRVTLDGTPEILKNFGYENFRNRLS